MHAWQRAQQVIRKRGRLFGWLFAFAALATVGSTLAPAIPRTVHVRLRLHSIAQDATRIDLDYLQGHETRRHASFHRPHDARTVLRHRVELVPGRYRLRVTVHDAGTSHVQRARFTVPRTHTLELDVPPRPRR
ncbi:MAG: hypothetical protein ACPGUV_02100 [Polyangiales bacterium]